MFNFFKKKPLKARVTSYSGPFDQSKAEAPHPPQIMNILSSLQNMATISEHDIQAWELHILRQMAELEKSREALQRAKDRVAHTNVIRRYLLPDDPAKFDGTRDYFA